jgi:hypothetical protein
MSVFRPEYRTAAGGFAPLRGNPRRTIAGTFELPVLGTFLREIDEYISDIDITRRNFRYGMNAFVAILARGMQQQALQRSRGPYDPQQRRPALAWRVPVRRITGAYYLNWKIRRLAPGIWQVYNDSREAFYIEYGIHTSGRRVRRPINKLSLIATLRWADRMGVGHRIWEGIFGPLAKPRKYGGRGSLLVQQGPQSGQVMPQLWMPRG